MTILLKNDKGLNGGMEAGIHGGKHGGKITRKGGTDKQSTADVSYSFAYVTVENMAPLCETLVPCFYK